MCDKIKGKELEKIREKYIKYQLEYSKQRELCDLLDSESNKSAQKRYEKESKRLTIISSKYRDIKSEYSQMIFEYFSRLNPLLINRKTKETITWKDVFSDSFDKLSDDQVRSLIPLVEEDGGKYRIMEH